MRSHGTARYWGMPLHIDVIRAEKYGGLIGLTYCPGKCDEIGTVAAQRQVLEDDIQSLTNWRACGLVTALEDEELRTFGVVDLGACATRAGIWWFRIPISETEDPVTHFWRAWPRAAPALVEMLRHGRRVVVHSGTDFGRSGLVAGCLLIELGLQPEQAVTAVRAAQPQAIGNPARELFVRRHLPRFAEHPRL